MRKMLTLIAVTVLSSTAAIAHPLRPQLGSGCKGATGYPNWASNSGAWGEGCHGHGYWDGRAAPPTATQPSQDASGVKGAPGNKNGPAVKTPGGNK